MLRSTRILGSSVRLLVAAGAALTLAACGADDVQLNGKIFDAMGVSSKSQSEAKVEPKVIDLPPESRVFVKVTVEALRVGRWGVHGMALEVRSYTHQQAPLAFQQIYIPGNVRHLELPSRKVIHT